MLDICILKETNKINNKEKIKFKYKFLNKFVVFFNNC